MARRASGGTPAITQLRVAGVDFAVHEFEHAGPPGRGFGLAAAEAMGADPARVFKTLVVLADGAAGVGIVPVHRQLSLKAIAGALGAKRAEMAPGPVAERLTGYVVGGISPFGQKRRLPTVLDLGAAEHTTILVSGGRRGLDLEIAPDDLVVVLGAAIEAIADG